MLSSCQSVCHLETCWNNSVYGRLNQWLADPLKNKQHFLFLILVFNHCDFITTSVQVFTLLIVRFYCSSLFKNVFVKMNVLHFLFSYVADTYSKQGLMYSMYTFYQYMCVLGIKPMTLWINPWIKLQKHKLKRSIYLFK